MAYVAGNHDDGLNALVAAEALLDKPIDGFCCYLQYNIPVQQQTMPQVYPYCCNSPHSLRTLVPRKADRIAEYRMLLK
mgnify:CR=1 FL=1